MRIQALWIFHVVEIAVITSLYSTRLVQQRTIQYHSQWLAMAKESENRPLQSEGYLWPGRALCGLAPDHHDCHGCAERHVLSNSLMAVGNHNSFRPRSHRNKPLWACYRWRSAGLRGPCDAVTPDLERKAWMACFSYPPNFEYLETHQCFQETGKQNVRVL